MESTEKMVNGTAIKIPHINPEKYCGEAPFSA
jgi:hypothetical protein